MRCSWFSSVSVSAGMASPTIMRALLPLCLNRVWGKSASPRFSRRVVAAINSGLAHRHVQGHKVQAGNIRIATPKPAEQSRPGLLCNAASKLPAGNAPGRKNTQCSARAQVVHGTAQHCRIGTCAIKVRAAAWGSAGPAAECAAGRRWQSREVGPRPAAQGGHHQALKRARGVVGIQDNRPLGGDASKVAAQTIGNTSSAVRQAVAKVWGSPHWGSVKAIFSSRASPEIWRAMARANRPTLLTSGRPGARDNVSALPGM